MTNEKAISTIENAKNFAYDDVYEEAFNMAIKALEQEPWETIKKIPKDYCYDTETKDFLVYRNKYTGHEIHIAHPTPQYKLESILDKIKAEIKALSNANPSYWHSGDMVDRDEVLDIIDKYQKEIEG